MADYISPFDFKTIFIDFFLGSIELFIFAFIILISYICAKFNMTNRLYLTILAICSLIFGAYLGNAIYVFVLFIVGFISFKSIARIVTQ